LRTVTEHAAAQAQLLKERFGLSGDADLAALSMVKLQEEVGEVAEAYLALGGHQRPEKLNGSTAGDRLGRLADEIADAVIVLAILAESLGLPFDEIVPDRLAHIATRSARNGASTNGHARSVPASKNGSTNGHKPSANGSATNGAASSLFSPDLVARATKPSPAALLAAAEAERRDARCEDRRPAATSMPHDTDDWSQLDLFG
jgi:NTP pyrophosphatase (non-canonical NTP hydrolase)